MSAEFASSLDPRLVVAAVHRGQWQALTERTRVAVAAVQTQMPDGSAVRIEAERFRRERRLESADRFHAWLADQGIAPDGWLDHIRRCVVLAAAPDVTPSHEPDEMAVVEAAWVDAACTGLWSEQRRWLARDSAVDRTDPSVDPVAALALADLVRQTTGVDREWTAAVVAVLQHDARLTDVSTIAADRFAGVIAQHRLAWTEYVLAGEAGEVRRVRGTDIPVTELAFVGSARPGSVVRLRIGEHADAQPWTVLDRIRPDETDPWVRAQAESAVLDLVAPVHPHAVEPSGPVATAVAGPPAAGTTDDRPVRARSRRPVRRVRFVPQLDGDDCGAACVAMVAGAFGRHVPVRRLREAAMCGPGGTSLQGIVEAGRAVGLTIAPYELSRRSIDSVPLPAIVHWDADHWAVLERLDARRAVVVDPAVGRRELERRAFDDAWTGFIATVERADGPQLVESSESTFRWLVPIVRSHVGALAVALALTVIAVVAGVAVPLVGQRLIDAVVRGDQMPVATVALLAASVVVAVIVDGARRRLLVRVSAGIDAELIELVTSRLLRLPLAALQRRRAGDLERRISGLGDVRRVVVQEGLQATSAVLVVVATTIAISVTSPVLGLVLLGAVPAYAVLATRSRTRLRPLFTAVEQAAGRAASSQLDLLRGVETVKVLAAEEAAQARTAEWFSRLRARTVPAQRALADHTTASGAIGLVLQAVVVVGGAAALSADRITAGGLVAAIGLFAMCLDAVQTIASTWDDAQLSFIALERLADVLEQEPERPAVSEPIHLGRLEGRIEVRGLGIVHPGRDVPTIEAVDLSIPPGAFVVIVGRSGSGKTTLLRAIAGLEPATTGEVLIDGNDIRTVDLVSLRSQIAHVLQTPYVFSATLAENVAFACLDIDEDAVRRALHAADLDAFVDSLPLGLATPLGEGGLPLAGGEAQRVAIARAIHREPRILLLDEPTSALDPEAEQHVRATLLRSRLGRTTVLVTHRLAVAVEADLVVVLEGGRIAEQGTHRDLLAADGLYAHLWRQQI